MNKLINNKEMISTFFRLKMGRLPLNPCPFMVGPCGYEAASPFHKTSKLNSFNILGKYRKIKTRMSLVMHDIKTQNHVAAYFIELNNKIIPT